MRHVSTLLPIAGTIALAACGCSDDDKSDASKTTATTAPASVTRASYIAEADAFRKSANAIARKLNERSQRAVNGANTDDARLAALEPILKEGFKVQTGKLKEFKAIPRPAADEAMLSKMISLNEQQTALVGELADAATKRDIERAGTIIDQQNTVSNRARKIAKSYGFKECGSGANEAG